MKIGYVLKTFPKISEKFIVNEIIELIKMGHDVYIFSIYNPSERIVNRQKIAHEEFLEYGLSKKTYYSPYSQRIILELTECVSTLLNKENNMIYNRLCIDVANYFAETIKDRRIELDILHAHFATESTYVAMILSRNLKIPFTLTAHAYDIFVDSNITDLREKFEKFENASAIITPSYYNMEYLYNLGINKNKIYVIRACPNIDKLKNLDRKEDGFTILSISRLVEKKGIDYGILAVEEIVKEYPETVYKIIGSGPLEKKLKMMITSLKLQNNVKIIGNLSDGALNNELSRATIFILPCIKAKNGDMDGIPVSLMESMYLRIPTISTDISGIPELIEDKITGLLVESENIDQLAGAIKKLLRDKDLRIKIENNGRKKVEEDFNLHKEVGKLVKVWDMIKR